MRNFALHDDNACGDYYTTIEGGLAVGKTMIINAILWIVTSNVPAKASRVALCGTKMELKESKGNDTTKGNNTIKEMIQLNQRKWYN